MMRNADALSRLPLSDSTGMEECSVHSFNLSEKIPLSQDEISRETSKDRILKKVFKMVKHGWPEKIDDDLKKYFNKNIALSIEDECLFYGKRIVIPSSLQHEILSMIHEGHIWVVRMKSLARNYVYWLNMDDDIEEYVRVCEPCQSQQSRCSGITPDKWPASHVLFEKVHIDFFYFKKDVFLILVDSFSKFFDVLLMSKTDALAVMGKLRTVFAYFGLPKTIVMDNGPPFRSEKYVKFCESNNIKLVHSPIYKPESNGLAERGVQTVKSA